MTKIPPAATHICVALAVFVVGNWLIGLTGRKRKTNEPPAPQPTITGGASQEDWLEVQSEAPPVPEGFKPMAEAQLPCSVKQFFQMLLSHSSGLPEELHALHAGHYDIVKGPWIRAEADVGFKRSMTFMSPVKSPVKGLGPTKTQCRQEHTYVLYKGQTLIYTCEHRTPDVPFGDLFSVNSFWKVTPAASGCVVSLYIRVMFKKWFMLKGVIEGSSISQTTEFYKAFLADIQRRISSGAMSSSSQSAAPSARQGRAAQISESDFHSRAIAASGAVDSVPQYMGQVLVAFCAVLAVFAGVYAKMLELRTP